MPKILLLEDDTVLSETLVELLIAEEFDVEHVCNGEIAVDITFIKNFDLFLLDVNVPYLNGFELLKSLRDSGNTTPAIFITALTDVSSLSQGFDVGADDYIKKPFDFDELLVRINALLRKQYKSYSSKLHVGKFHFNIDSNELYYDNKFMQLSPAELKIVKLLFKNLDKTILKEDILNELSDGREVSEGSLRVHMTKLRKVGLSIDTIKGIGYRLAK